MNKNIQSLQQQQYIKQNVPIFMLLNQPTTLPSPKKHLPTHSNNTFLAPSKQKQKPLQRSSKKPFKSQSYHQSKTGSVDPRFMNYAGNFNKDLFQKSYSFIENIMEKEINVLKKRLKNKRYSDDNRKVLETKLNKLTSQVSKKKEKDTEHEVKRQFKKKVSQALKQKKRPYFPKKSKIKEEIVRRKFNQLGIKKKQQKYLQLKKKLFQKKKIREYKRMLKIKKNK